MIDLNDFNGFIMHCQDIGFLEHTLIAVRDRLNTLGSKAHAHVPHKDMKPRQVVPVIAEPVPVLAEPVPVPVVPVVEPVVKESTDEQTTPEEDSAGSDSEVSGSDTGSVLQQTRPAIRP